MVQAVRKRVTIKRGGIIETQDPELPEGAEAEVIIVLLEEQPKTERRPITDMLGAARGVYGSPEEADAFIRSLRDEWE